MVFCIEKRNTCSLQMVVYFELFRSFLQSTSYILVTAPSRAPALSWLLRLVRRRDFGDQQPALSSCSKQFSDGSNVKATDRIPSTTCLEYQFDNLSSAVGLALNPSFPSRILSCTAWRWRWRFLQAVRDKIRDEKPGLEATGGGFMLTLTPK